jgi:hypothetical protein
MSVESKWSVKQLTQEQAVKMKESGVWKEWTAVQIVRFQMFQMRLCIDFDHYHRCIQEVLKRTVFTYEFAFRDDIIEEYLGMKPIPTLEESINLIPQEKRTVLGL